MIRQAQIAVIRQYQKYISPSLGTCCKYYPTCSQYMIDAVEEYGVVIGTAMGMGRIARCNPFSSGGYDPVNKKRNG